MSPTPRTFEDHLAHGQALAKLVALACALAAEHPNATSVRELAGSLAFVADVIDDTIERALQAELEDHAARRPSRSGRREPAGAPVVRR